MATTTINVNVNAAGSNGQIQFNDSGSFGADSVLVWDNTNKRLGVGASPASTVRLDVRAQGALSTDIAFRVRNSADTQNFLVVNGAGDVFNNGASGLNSNTFYGENVGRTVSSQYNSFFGNESGRFNTTGQQNNFFGFHAGRNNTTGSFNTFIGVNSGLSNTTGQFNSFFGNDSGRFSNASFNAFFGYFSGRANTTGQFNSFFGNSSGNKNTIGVENSFFGHASGGDNTTGSFNTFIGVNSATFLNSGSNNTYLGHNSGRQFLVGNLTISNNSVFIGKNTKALDNNQTNQIVIGFDAIGAGSNTATLGNTSIVKTILRGTINAAGLPTSPAGLVAGDIWNDSGTLKIV